MPTAEKNRTYIEISYKDNGYNITSQYVVSPYGLHKLEVWFAEQKAGATEKELDNEFWLWSHGGKEDYNGIRRAGYFREKEQQPLSPLTALPGVKIYPLNEAPERPKSRQMTHRHCLGNKKS